MLNKEFQISGYPAPADENNRMDKIYRINPNPVHPVRNLFSEERIW